MREVILTQEKQEKLKGCYLITDRRMCLLGKHTELTKENFKAFWVDQYNTLQELGAKDFCYDDEKDYAIKGGDSYVFRAETPEEVRKLLDAVITTENEKV